MTRAIRQKTWDAIVVGSGIAGGWAAKELTEKGLNTLVLEAGGPIDPARDYSEHKTPDELPLRGFGDRRRMAAEQPVQSRCESFSEYNAHLWVNDRENPYTHPDGRPFEFLRGRHVGGRSLTWGRRVYRWSPLDFEANARDGIAVPWPIGYADLAPWYDHVESFIGVSGRAEGLAHLPDGKFLPPMGLSCGERLLEKRIAAAFKGERVVTAGRAAVLTQDHRGRKACHYCGPCERGCVTRSYFSSNSVTLPAAAETGRLTLRPHSVVRSLLFDPKRGRVSGVAIIDAQNRNEIELEARVVFLCASTLESTRILLNSKSTRFPQGMANSSGQLGRNLMDHLAAGGAIGTMPELAGQDDPGRRPNGIYIPRFRNVKEKHPAYARGFALQGEIRRHGMGVLFQRPRLWPATFLPADGAAFGPAFKKSLFDTMPWTATLSGFGECLPHPGNRVTIDPKVVDKWGIPAFHVDATWGANEVRMWDDIRASSAEILEAGGLKNVALYGPKTPGVPGHGAHEMGTARMGLDPKTSVLNSWNQTHDIPNLFVTDGSCMTSSGTANPSLTYMALTARAADHAANLLKRGEL